MTSRREITLAGEKVWLCGMTGQVAGDKKWSETRVQSRHVPGQYGHTVIDTKVNTRHEFWLVAPDGEERAVEFFNSQVSVREGQWMTAIWGARMNKKDGPFLMLQNNNAQVSIWLISDAKSLLQRMGLADPMVKYGLIGLAGTLVSWVLFHTWLFSLLVFLFGFIVGSHMRKTKAGTVKTVATEAMNLELQSFTQSQQPSALAKGAAGMLAP